MPNQKKFLDAAGVTHLVQLLDNYPNNDILGTVISSIQEVLDTKGTYSKPAGGIPATDIADGVIPDSIMDLTNDSNFVSASFDNDNLVLQTGGQSTSIMQPVTDAVEDLKSAINVLEPAATSFDVGKALIAKTVKNGKVTEYEFGEASGGRLTTEIKSALLACFQHAAWIDADGQDYYDALESALYDTEWPVTNTLGHCTTSNGATSVTKGSAYLATITPAGGYTLTGATVSITMGGDDITSDAYSNGTISIAAVTGALVITVTAISIRESLFGTFENGYAVGTSVGYAGRTIASARACPTKPFLNDGYTFTVTDSSKYQVNAVDATSDVAVEVSSSYGYVGNIAYARGTKTVGWNSSDSVTTTYCWLALKKIDGTAFTAEELSDGAAAVFTYTNS